MKIGSLSGRRSVGGMERESACLAKTLTDWGKDVWFFQNDAWFWKPVPENDPTDWYNMEGLRWVKGDDLINELIDTDVVFLTQSAVLDGMEKLVPYINSVPLVVELSGVMPKFLTPHKNLTVDRYLIHINMNEEQAERRKEPIEKMTDWPGNVAWVESEPAEVREKEWLTFGCLSRQDYIKKLNVLIDAFKGIEGEHKLVLVGDGHDGEKLRAQAADDKRISFPGMVNDRGKVEEWFKSFDVFVMTSDWEGAAQSVKEAMALGLPCIVSNGGGTPALVGDAAVVVPVDDTEGVRAAMLGMINTKTREDYRQRSLARAEHLAGWAEETLAALLAEAKIIPRVSVITPVGPRHGEIVIEAIESVADQSFWPLEMVVVSDGAEINAEAIAEHDFLRVLKLQRPSGGQPGVVRNAAASAAIAKLLFPIDADDLAMPRSLEAFYNAWRHNPIGVKFGGVVRQYPNNKCVYSTPANVSAERVRKGGIHSVSSLFPKCIWECIGGFPEDDLGFEDARFFAIAETAFGWEQVPVHAIIYRYDINGQWARDRMRSDLRTIPEDRVQYHTWVRNKLKEVFAMGNCSGCPGGGGGSRGAGIVANNPGRGGVLSGVGEELIPVRFLGSQTRYHVNTKVEGSKVHYRFGSRPRDQVKYVLPGDANWMGSSKLFELVTPSQPVASPVTSAPQVAQIAQVPVARPRQPDPASVDEVVIRQPFSGPLGQVDLTPTIKVILIAEGFDTVEKLRGATLQQLMDIPGIGQATVRRIREAIGGDDSEVASSQPSDVETDELVSTRKRPRRPVPEAAETRRRDRPRRRTGRE